MSTATTEAAQTTLGRRVRPEDFQFFVRQIYRLFRISTMHLQNNEAVHKMVEQTKSRFRELRSLELTRLNILFVDRTVFVNGQLLKAEPEIYQLSLQLAAFIQKLGYNELSIAWDVDDEDLRALMRVFVGSYQIDDRERDEVRFERVSLRRVKSEILELLRTPPVSARERLVRSYASALIVLRHAWQRLEEGQPPAFKSLKRVVQQMVRSANENPVAFQLMARMRNTHDDHAGQATKTAMVAIAMMRPLTDDIRRLTRIGLAALYHDLGIPRAMRNGGQGGIQIGDLPDHTAAIGMLASQLHPESLERIILAYEAQALQLAPELVPLPEDPAIEDLEPVILYTARRYVRGMAFDIQTQRAAEPAEAIIHMAWNARNRLELIAIQMLCQGVRILIDPALFRDVQAARIAETRYSFVAEPPGRLPPETPIDASGEPGSVRKGSGPRPTETGRHANVGQQTAARTGQHASVGPPSQLRPAPTGQHAPIGHGSVQRTPAGAMPTARDTPTGAHPPTTQARTPGEARLDDLLKPYLEGRTGVHPVIPPTGTHGAIPAPPEQTEQTRYARAQPAPSVAMPSAPMTALPTPTPPPPGATTQQRLAQLAHDTAMRPPAQDAQQQRTVAVDPRTLPQQGADRLADLARTSPNLDPSVQATVSISTASRKPIAAPPREITSSRLAELARNAPEAADGQRAMPTMVVNQAGMPPRPDLQPTTMLPMPGAPALPPTTMLPMPGAPHPATAASERPTPPDDAASRPTREEPVPDLEAPPAAASDPPPTPSAAPRPGEPLATVMVTPGQLPARRPAPEPTPSTPGRPSIDDLLARYGRQKPGGGG
jgi:hypothetical protein